MASNVHLDGGTGDVDVSAVNLTTANAFGLGYSGDLSLSSDTSIAGAVGLNVADITNTAVVHSGAQVSGADITVEAVAPASKTDEFIVWAVAAAAGKNTASVAASVGVQVLSLATSAYVEAGVKLDTPGNLTVHAQAPIGLLNLAVSGGFSKSGTAVGGAIAVNVLDGIDTEAYIDSGTITNITHVDAGGALQVKAEASIDPLTPQLPSGASRLQGLMPQVSSVALGGSAAGGSDPAVTGSIVVDVISTTTNAEIKSGAHVNDTRQNGAGQTVEVTAKDDTSLINAAGAVALSLSGAGIAVSIIVDVIDKSVTASIDSGAQVYAGGTVTVQALSTETLFELAVGGAASGSSAAVTGSLIVVVMDEAGGQGTSASIAGKITSLGQTHVKASDTSDKIEMYAGSVAISASSAGVGVSVTVLVRKGAVDAHIASTADLTVGSLLVEAIQNGTYILVAGAGAGGSSAGVAGSVVVDVPTDTTTATLDGTTNAGGTVAVSASDTSDITSVAGQISIGGDAGVGVGIDVEVITKTTTAQIAPTANVTTTSGGDVTVDATSSENALSIAAGIALGGTAAVAVNATVSAYDITTDAYIGDGGLTGTGQHAVVVADGTVRVAADEGLTLNIIAGNVSVGGSAGIGAAAAVPVLTKNTNAEIGAYAQVTGKGNGAGLTVETGEYTLTPQDTRFNGANVAGGTIDTGTDLGFKTGDTVTYDPGDGTAIGGLATGTVYWVDRVDATHVKLADSKADLDAGTYLPLTPGSGESNRLVGTNQAQAPADSSPRFNPASDVSGNTINLPYTLSLSTGDPVVYGAGGGTPIGGLTDGGTYYVISEGGNSYELAATSDDANNNNPITLDKSKATGTSHSLVKQGNMPSANADDSAPQTVAEQTSTGFRGVAVTATNSDNVNAVGVAASIGGAAGVGVGGTVDVITVDTNATVAAHATVNSVTIGRNSGQSVLVASGNQFHLLLVAASLAIGGGAGVGASVDVGVLSIDATSLVDDYAQVQAAKDVVVSATQQETIVAVTFAAGGGTVGVAGAVGVIVLNTKVLAETGSHVTITAGNNAAFLARDDTSVTGITGGVAGGLVGVGVGVYVLDLTKDTQATVASTSSVTANTNTTDGLAGISDGTVDQSSGFGFATFRGVAIQAQSSENIFGLVISIGGGFVGVAVPVGVTLVNVTTQATLAGTASSNLDVNISALDDMKTITISGGVGAGAVGIGAGVDIGVADNNTAAVLASTGVITTARDVAINALARKNVTTYTFAVGGGAVGVAGAVSVWSLGTEGSSSYSDGQGDNGSGLSEVGSSAWESGHDYSKGDHASYNGKDYIANVDDPDESTNPSSNTTGWELGSSTNPAGSADDQATDSSGNGYTSILNGSTTSATGWTSGHDYASGSEVTYGGKTYVATVDDPDESTTPDLNSSQWRDGSTDAHFSSMIATHTGDANSSISSNKPTGTLTQAALSTPINAGTSAQLMGHITATGDVTVNGHDVVAFGGIVGSAAGGIVGVGASILVGSIDAQTTAEVGGDAVISAGGELYVHANLDENTSTLAFAGAGGAIGVAAQVSVLNDSSTQTAEIDDSATIHKALNGIDVKAENDRSVSALTIGGAIGGVAAGAAIGYVGLSGSTTASVGDVTIGDTNTVSSLTVEAHDASHASTEAIAVAAGIGIGLAGAVALSHVNPTTSATLSGSATITTTGAVNVTADATPQADSEAIGVGVAGVAGLGVSYAEATANGSVTASVGDGADYSAGSLTVTASRLNPTESQTPTTYADAIAGGGGILLGASGAIANASSTATVTASLGN
ncbi:MAG: beta strand repeat-containing protein, partial [Gaiellaceae bacterium]